MNCEKNPNIIYFVKSTTSPVEPEEGAMAFAEGAAKNKVPSLNMYIDEVSRMVRSYIWTSEREIICVGYGEKVN
jgi:hypothetical protein